MSRRPRTRAVIVVAMVLGLAGCGDDPSGDAGAPASGSTAVADGATATTTGRGAPRPGDRPAATTPGRPSGSGDDDGTTTGDGPSTPADPGGAATIPSPPRSWTARCPTPTKSALGCRAVRGRVLAIQSLDPDGDGDLHVIAVGGDVTAPGITVFDVRRSLRPGRDPVKGEYVTGAGPVFRGSLGQRQIQVDVFRVWRPRD